MMKRKIYRTGLAVMLAGLFFIVTIPFPASLAQDRRPLESDSLLIERHILEVLTGETIEEFSEHSFNSHLSREQLDSILWEDERTRITGAEMSWAPDSSFRICTVQMESCGGYCNPSWTSWLHFNDGSGFVISEISFCNILSIHKMKDGKYLLKETSYGRSGMYSCRTDVAYLFSIDNYTIKYHTFPDPRPDAQFGGRDKTIGVTLCSYYGDPEDCSLTFDNNKGTLTYHNSEDAGYIEIPDSISVYDGVLIYEDTGFVVKSSTERRIKFVELD